LIRSSWVISEYFFRAMYGGMDSIRFDGEILFPSKDQRLLKEKKTDPCVKDEKEKRLNFVWWYIFLHGSAEHLLEATPLEIFV